MNTQYEHYDTIRLKAISITEVARRLGESIKKAGAQYVGICPWHDDHHPSLSFVTGTDKNYCHCFSCGKGGDVISYTMAHEGWTFQDACQWLSSTFGISTTSYKSEMPVPRQKAVSKPVEPCYTFIPMNKVDELVSYDNSLCRCLMKMFSAEAVKALTEEYRLGCYSMYDTDDYTVFPNIDCQGRVHNLKVQHYDTNLHSPRFAHSDKGTVWLGRIWADNGLLPKEAVFSSNCLFGEHLLSLHPSARIALVESPKNALYGALVFPQWLWVAVGNKHQLKREVLKPLQGRDVAVIPDADGVELWTETLSHLADLANFSVSDFCKRVGGTDQPKYDIADYLQEQRLPLPF